MTTITDDGMTDEVDWERAGRGGEQNHKKQKTSEKKKGINRTHDTNAARKKNQCPKLSTTKNNFKKRVKKKRWGRGGRWNGEKTKHFT